MGKDVFLDREEDLRALDEIYERPGTHLAVVYGRRRVGKTRLLLQFAKDKPHVFYTAIKKTETQQALEFSEEMEKLVAHDTPIHHDNWRDAIGYMFESYVGRSDKVVVVIDEFPEVWGQNKSVPGEISARLERFAGESNMMLVLCGSAVRQMEQLLGGREPLYLRQSLMLKVKPLDLTQASLFLEEWDFTSRVEAYAVMGGMPMYLSEAARHRNLRDFIAQKVINPRGLFFGEGNTIVGQELGDVAMYFGLLEAIAGGAGKLADISSAVGKKAEDLSVYLRKIEGIQLIKREVPATEKNPVKSKKGRYVITDNFVRFWFRFVHPYAGLIDAGQQDLVMKRVEAGLSTFLGRPTEEVVRQAVLAESTRGNLPITVTRLGRYWDKNREIDICGAGEKKREYLWGECKWQNSKMGAGVYHLLKEKVDASGVNPGGKNSYLLCSKSGFTPKLRSLAAKEEIILWDAKALERIMA